MLKKYFKLLYVASALYLSINPFVAMADACVGQNQLPRQFQGHFTEIQNSQLLQKALGQPNEGSLCQGKVYRTTEDVVVYRAWNSTNPRSEMGKFWSLEEPKGATSKYRQDYEICYQWSPLDQLSTCTLKAGAEVVIGTGQSTQCSQYLAYPASGAQQVYLDQPNGNSVVNCTKYLSIFNWQPVKDYETVIPVLAQEKQCFKASKSCPVHNSLRKKENLAGLLTEVNKSYPIIQNDHDDFIYIRMQEGRSGNRWVEKSCGTVEQCSSGAHIVNEGPTRVTFEPFFVNDKSKAKDCTPLRPEIKPFDQNALEACGEWGHHIDRADLERLFSDETLKSLYKDLDKKVVTADATLDVFKKELIDIWLDYHAFEHVICGQPGNHNRDNKLGGLHYVGRYLEMQQKKWGGLNKQCNKNEIKDPIYTIGVDFVTPNGEIATKCPSGYSYDLHVYDLILGGTKAFKQAFNIGDQGEIACIFNDGRHDYVFVKGSKEIVTFYPVISARPNMKSCNGMKRSGE